MAGNADAYSVDLEALDSVIGDLERCERELESTTKDLERQVQRLHQQWEGLSATAQREAHQEWEAGMNAMRASLAEMRQAARVAHGNYTRAIGANLGMWEGLQ